MTRESAQIIKYPFRRGGFSLVVPAVINGDKLRMPLENVGATQPLQSEKAVVAGDAGVDDGSGPRVPMLLTLKRPPQSVVDIPGLST